MKPPHVPEALSAGDAATAPTIEEEIERPSAPRWQFSHELAVSVGGVLGSSARVAIGAAAGPIAPATLPLGTLLVNVIGCFLIGVAQTLFLDLLTVRREIQLFVSVGFLGGLTTFSTFSLDTVRLLQAGAITPAIVYQGLSLSGGLLAALLGIASTHAVFRWVQQQRAR